MGGAGGALRSSALCEGPAGIPGSGPGPAGPCGRAPSSSEQLGAAPSPARPPAAAVSAESDASRNSAGWGCMLLQCAARRGPGWLQQPSSEPGIKKSPRSSPAGLGWAGRESRKGAAKRPPHFSLCALRAPRRSRDAGATGRSCTPAPPRPSRLPLRAAPRCSCRDSAHNLSVRGRKRATGKWNLRLLHHVERTGKKLAKILEKQKLVQVLCSSPFECLFSCILCSSKKNLYEHPSLENMNFFFKVTFWKAILKLVPRSRRASPRINFVLAVDAMACRSAQ